MSESGGVSMVEFLACLRSEGADIDASEFVILMVLAGRSFKPGNCLYQWTDKVAQGTLAKESKLSLRKASDALRKLDTRGIILRQTGGKKREIHRYCVTAKLYANYLIFLRDTLGRPIEKGLSLLQSIKPADEVCQLDLASEISRSANCAYQNELDKQTVPNQIELDKQTVPISDKHDVPTERGIRKEEFKGKEESPPTPQTGVGGLGGGVSSFSFFPSLRHFRVFYNNAIKTGLLTGAWPEHLPRRTERALESTIAKYPMSDWAKYFRALKPVLADYSGQTGFPRIILERPTFEARIKDFQNKGKK